MRLTVQLAEPATNRYLWVQRYDRIAFLMHKHPGLRSGMIGKAKAFLIDAPALWELALEALEKDPLYFVDPTGNNP